MEFPDTSKPPPTFLCQENYRRVMHIYKPGNISVPPGEHLNQFVSGQRMTPYGHHFPMSERLYLPQVVQSQFVDCGQSMHLQSPPLAVRRHEQDQRIKVHAPQSYSQGPAVPQGVEGNLSRAAEQTQFVDRGQSMHLQSPPLAVRRHEQDQRIMVHAPQSYSQDPAVPQGYEGNLSRAAEQVVNPVKTVMNVQPDSLPTTSSGKPTMRLRSQVVKQTCSSSDSESDSEEQAKKATKPSEDNVMHKLKEVFDEAPAHGRRRQNFKRLSLQKTQDESDVDDPPPKKLKAAPKVHPKNSSKKNKGNQQNDSEGDGEGDKTPTFSGDPDIIVIESDSDVPASKPADSGSEPISPKEAPESNSHYYFDIWDNYEPMLSPETDKEFDCVICHTTWEEEFIDSPIYRGVLLPCKHDSYCFKCAVSLKENLQRCAICRSEIQGVESAIACP